MSKQYLYRVEILNKKDKHPLESIAYYSGEKQYDILNTKSYESNTSEKVMWSEIIIPAKNGEFEQFSQLPDYLKFRSKKPDLISNARNILWKSVHDRENRPDSQFARLFELSVPNFLSVEEGINLLTAFCKTLTAEGMIVDGSLHNHNMISAPKSIFEQLNIVPSAQKNTIEKQQDYTGFLMCTLRDYSQGQFVNKNREWNNHFKLKEWRAIWVNLLANSIENAENCSTEDKENWINKLKIYPEYKSKKKMSVAA